jgi:hypothetical protein
VITAEARDYAAGITVEVGPAGGLRAISLNHKSMRLGAEGLAAAILDLVRTATAQANQRARLALPDDLREADLDALGIPADTQLAEAIELTTPDTWMR